MRTTLLCALTIPFMGASLVAQVPPGITTVDMTATPWRPPTKNDLHPANMRDTGGNLIWPGSSASSTSLGQLELRRTGAAGTYRLAATLNNATGPIAGGAGFDAFEGSYVPGTSTVTLTNLAATFNTATDEFAFSISDDGLFAVCDQAGTPQFANRGALGAAWGATANIVGAGASYLDSKLVRSGGNDYYAHTDALGGISMGAINRVNGQVTGISIVITPLPGIQFCHSHHPIVDNAGNLKAWIVGQYDGADTDSFFVPGPNDTSTNGVGGAGFDSAQKIWDDTTWQANPTQFNRSGSTYWAWSAPAPNNYKAPLDLEMVLQGGGKVTAGQPYTINAWVPGNGNPWGGVLAIGVSGTPIALNQTVGNGIGDPVNGRPKGQFGLNPVAFVSIGWAGIGNLQLTVPIPATFPTGVPLTIQSGLFDLTTTGPIVMSNTATIQG